MDVVTTQAVINNVSRGVESLLEGSSLEYESELTKFNGKLAMVKLVLDDRYGNADHLSCQERDCIHELNDAVYEADDLFDELLANVQRKRALKVVVSSSKKKKNILGIHRLFSLSDDSHVPKALKRIQEKCDQFVTAFRSLNDVTIVKSRVSEGSYSFCYTPDVIGRESDVTKILGIMLQPPIQDDVGFLSIVGMGGSGKTTVTQLVFNHPRVVIAFTFKSWVYVGEGERFGFEAICASLLESAGGYPKTTGLDPKDQVLKLLEGKRFLIVIDDVWSENAQEWNELEELLAAGAKGSWILYTTRSSITASIMGTRGLIHELSGLAEEHSWRLFRDAAFDAHQESDFQLVEIGKSIVSTCPNLPLALKTVGSLLRGEDRHKWLAVQGSIIDNTFFGSTNIIPILKLSYDHLEPPVKCCFRFCALFPKGFEIRKDLLISLWMAQGYIVPLPAVGKSVEDVATEYFMTLFNRNFFQDVEMDEYGDIVSCRMHELMHVLAQQVAGEEIHAVKILTNLPERSRHVFYVGKEGRGASFTNKMRIRTFLVSGFSSQQFPVAQLVANSMSLRALSLHDLGDNSLPESIGNLIHLRYLDLSRNKALEMLPKSLKKLYLLETLNLRDCSKLKELPSDLSKLMLLRHLDIFGCPLLTCMPPNMDNLIHLRTLTSFVVDDGESSGKLEDLKALNNLKGSIEILIPADYKIAGKNEIQEECLRKMDRIKVVCIHFQEGKDATRHSDLLKKLQPPENLVGLTLKGYLGSAVNWEASIQKLVKLELISCATLTQLPFLSGLASLKSLTLRNLVFKYMQDASSFCASAATVPGSDEPVPFNILPSLEYLEISGLCKLKAWSACTELLDDDLTESRQLSFPRLSNLKIQNCPELGSFPLCPNVKKMCLNELNATTFSIFDLCPDWHLVLEDLEVDNVGYLKSMPTSHERVHSSVNLRNLKIGGHLKRVEPSAILEESQRGKTEVGSEDDEAWKLLHQSLFNLELDGLEKMVNLPMGMQHLTALQHLTISHCHNLKVIPEWISCLTSLESLCIRFCSGLNLLPESMRQLTSLRHLEIQGHSYLQKRCRPIHGEDWPKIQHIHSISLHQSS